MLIYCSLLTSRRGQSTAIKLLFLLCPESQSQLQPSIPLLLQLRRIIYEQPNEEFRTLYWHLDVARCGLGIQTSCGPQWLFSFAGVGNTSRNDCDPVEW
ncbi:hypothetical protein B0J14DRAFT_595812 [Halenospora varia]|nr:hypothetical protein B0J14DRAFT_595812 [Halenospora varia]